MLHANMFLMNKYLFDAPHLICTLNYLINYKTCFMLYNSVLFLQSSRQPDITVAISLIDVNNTRFKTAQQTLKNRKTREVFFHGNLWLNCCLMECYATPWMLWRESRSL